MEDERIDRRGSLLRIAGLAAAAAGGAAWKTASGDAAGPTAVASGLVTCVLAPEMTEGPYYVSGAKVRSDITAGKPGAPLALRLGVANVATCKPIAGAAVDVWHADAGGVYSDEQVENTVGQTFLRGVQRTGVSGFATFRSIYPGWYPGRTVHIHVKVHIGGNVVHTGQLFFDDALTDAVYRRAPYAARPNRDTRNANDSIYVNGGSRSLLSVKRHGSGYAGTIWMGVHA
ncbi:MAG TPA: intradiol ring-cleavage dioxygenase [Gaiellaceae bacterium]|nr:intradiol ring-cleavage dioxygenase [Gaiellaceae bacterium]